MPGYRDLLKLLRKGKKPSEIMEELEIPPSRLRRMLASEGFKREIKLEKQLTRTMTSLQSARGSLAALERLGQLLLAENEETARKVCMSLLEEDRELAELLAAETRPGGGSPAPLAPWMKLTPLLETAEDPLAGGEDR
jgi:DNA-binding MarR family transcriptional regulator